MDKKQIATGAVGIIGVFLAILGTIYFTPEQLENTYICLSTEEVGIFYGGISKTGLSAYPHAENRSDVERCYTSNGDKSTWVKFTDYLEENGLSLDEFLQPKVIVQQNIGKSYLCSVDGCVEK